MSDTASEATGQAPAPPVTAPAASEVTVPAPPTTPPLPAPAPAPPQPRPSLATRISGMRPTTALTLGAVAGAALVALAWVGTTIDFADAPDTFTTTGGIFLMDPDGFTNDSGSCTGDDGYDDLDAGTEVTISDASGTVVAADSLTTGEVVGTTCLFKFTVHGIPAGSKLYRVEVSHRGDLTKTEAELRKGDIAFTLGG
ncbi:hypothetical protein [Streptomyces sp. NPDC059909]|uniref:hypothetical protein n=1 Tax=Streptomyces sp. NPDC059909 TaxID=3346998 RepID=UPI00364E1837